jgi:hypothetical protein
MGLPWNLASELGGCTVPVATLFFLPILPQGTCNQAGDGSTISSVGYLWGCEVPGTVGPCTEASPCCVITSAWQNICVRNSTIWGSVLVKASFIDPMIISFTVASLPAWNMPSL